MKINSIHWWVKVCLFNLLIVSLLGVIMRYKIGFELPMIDQKNSQLAHSNFAFLGWVSLILMVMLLKSMKEKDVNINFSKYYKLLLSYLIGNYSMIVSLFCFGYNISSIIFLIITVFLSIGFSVFYLIDSRKIKSYQSTKWFKTSLIFNILSTFGSFYLMYIMATRSVEQHAYLTTTYWYLHFQYNGWFFFACIGLAINFLEKKSITLNNSTVIFRYLTISCVPAFGLSMLWMNMPFWIYIIIVIFAFVQFIGLIKLLLAFKNLKLVLIPQFDKITKLLLIGAALAILIKFSLQLGSTVPSINKFAFGFRPIVIAYLHLVLLAFTSIFILAYLYIEKFIISSKLSILGLFLFIGGVFANEFILALQGIASINYNVIPYTNTILFIISLVILLSLIVINYTTIKKTSQSKL